MRIRRTFTGLGLLALMGLSGCVGAGMPWQRTAQKAPEPPPPPAQREIPQGKVAELCWTTGEELRKRGYEAEAIAQYEHLRTLEPRWPKLAWRLAVLYDRQGNDAAALAEYERALEQEPDNPDLLNDRAYFHCQRGDDADAERWARAALARDAKHVRATNNLGMVLARQGKVKEAHEAFSRVLPRAKAHYNLGVLLAQQGQAERAREELRQALAIDPGLAKARAVLDWLDRAPASQSAAARPHALTPGIPRNPSVSFWRSRFRPMKISRLARGSLPHGRSENIDVNSGEFRRPSVLNETVPGPPDEQTFKEVSMKVGVVREVVSLRYSR